MSLLLRWRRRAAAARLVRLTARAWGLAPQPRRDSPLVHAWTV